MSGLDVLLDLARESAGVIVDAAGKKLGEAITKVPAGSFEAVVLSAGQQALTTNGVRGLHALADLLEAHAHKRAPDTMALRMLDARTLTDLAVKLQTTEAKQLLDQAHALRVFLGFVAGVQKAFTKL